MSGIGRETRTMCVCGGVGWEGEDTSHVARCRTIYNTLHCIRSPQFRCRIEGHRTYTTCIGVKTDSKSWASNMILLFICHLLAHKLRYNMRTITAKWKKGFDSRLDVVLLACATNHTLCLPDSIVEGQESPTLAHERSP